MTNLPSFARWLRAPSGTVHPVRDPSPTDLNDDDIKNLTQLPECEDWTEVPDIGQKNVCRSNVNINWFLERHDSYS